MFPVKFPSEGAIFPQFRSNFPRKGILCPSIRYQVQAGDAHEWAIFY